MKESDFDEVAKLMQLLRDWRTVIKQHDKKDRMVIAERDCHGQYSTLVDIRELPEIEVIKFLTGVETQVSLSLKQYGIKLAKGGGNN